MKVRREKIQELVLSVIGKLKEIDVDGANYKRYQDEFKNMTDKKFKEWMSYLKGGGYIHMIVPNGSPTIGFDKLEKIGAELGIKFWDNVTQYDGGGAYTPTQKYLMLNMSGKKTKQTTDKALAVSNSVNVRNPLTGQVTNASKSAAITLPEIELLLAHGFKNVVGEFTSMRGGDVKAGTAMSKYLEKYGDVHFSDVEPYRDGVQSTKTLKGYMIGMHMRLKTELPNSNTLT